MSHEKIETNLSLLIVLIIVVISIGGLVEIVPLFATPETTEPVEGVEKYSALRLEGRDVYIREGCYNCHSQMIRPFRAETERYGHYSVAGESIGTSLICTIPATWFRNPTCPPIPGCLKPSWMARTPLRR